MPFFSVVIPLYNKENYIQDTIESALNQTFADFEIIVVNDGSTDESLNIVENNNDSRIKTHSIKNSGVSRARNIGIQKAKSDYIVFLDADDLWEKNHLEELYKLLKANPDCGIYAMGYFKIFNNNKPIKASFHGHDNFCGIVENFFLASTIDCIAWTSAVMIPKTIFNTIGGFNETIRSGQDTELWIRIALKYKVAFCSKATANKIINFDEYHLSNSKFKSDRLKIFSFFVDEESINHSLKEYLDLNRLSIAIECKIQGDEENYKILRKLIDENHLNFTQKILLRSSKIGLVFLKKIQLWLIMKKIYLTPFKR
jgi:glycosyltransferase involved in cell wall biosynthesis